MSLLQSLLAKNASANPENVESAKAELTTEPVTELVGINPPEFDLPENKEEDVDVLEMAFEAQPQKSFRLNEDGLDDDEEELTPDHVSTPVPVEEFVFESDLETDDVIEELKEEPLSIQEQWKVLSFDHTFFGFGGRTVNSLQRANLNTFMDIEGMAYSELLAIKGFGRNCLNEIVDFLNEQNEESWLKKRVNSNESEPVQEPIQEPATPMIQEECDDLVARELPQQTLEVPTVVAQESVNVEQVEPEVITESEPKEKAAQANSNLKILILGGNCDVLKPGLNVRSFEAQYSELISRICTAQKVPTLSLVEYGKGWGLLAAGIRDMGWDNSIDVLTVSKSFLGKPELVMELRLLADLVIEA
jgi:hypothetical protein